MSITRIELSAPTRSAFLEVDEYDGVLIKGVKFVTAFSLGQLEAGTQFKIKYLKERWAWFNDHCFGGVMKPPDSWEISKNFKDIKLFGSWNSFYRRIKMHPKLWQLKNESQCLGTLLHEMAHQYETEHEPRGQAEDAHGPTWQGIMRRVGLSPRAKWVGKQEDLRSIHEERVVQRMQRATRKATPELLVGEYNLAVYVNMVKGRKTPLVIIGGFVRTPAEGWRTTFVPGFSDKVLTTNDLFRWYEVSNLYLPDVPEIQADFPKTLLSEKAKLFAKRIHAELTARNKRP